MDEEVVMLEEQLAGAQADIERLQTRLADSEALVAQRTDDATALQRQLAEQEQALNRRGSEVEELRAALGGAEAEARTAAESYRGLVLQREPDLPADLIGGDSVAEIDASVSRARQTIAQVRQHMEEQAQALRVPAGAPARGGPDVSGLTPGEKIRLGMRRT
ncbi:MAG TPA: hypothetical protein VFY10_03965 [Dehalococcoidia bacterium]|nr:hypothetical protein [Dehalococcoidia bacterium]